MNALTQAHKIARELTVIVPAYNEAESIADTIKSIQSQTTPPKEIIVVDDFSSDDTGDIARSHGVRVVRPPQNTGSKAGAQNFALVMVTTRYTMAIDADTTLAPDAIEKLAPALKDAHIACACGFVVPRKVETVWERGRYIEYLFAFTFYKPIQDYFGKILISSGCFSIYRTDVLKQVGGWPTRTMAEDMDLTWTFYNKHYGTRFVPDAVCYPIEPSSFHIMRKQLNRWSHGFVQNLMLHWQEILQIPYLRMAITVALWDTVSVAIAYLLLIPLLTILFQNPFFLLAYVIDAPAVFVPVFLRAQQRQEINQALVSFPAFFLLRVVNSIFILEAIWSELVRGKRLLIYEKGH